ncbi:MAG: nitroreductase [Syntrophomonadaceae bacterium]|jgi:nitroreductase
MDIINAIKSRKSIRGYLPKPVPQDIIREILEAAIRTPSAVNSQPWEMIVVCGEVLENIKRDNVKNFLSEIPLEEHSAYPGIYKQRRVELAKDIFKLLDIKREDREKRKEWTLRGFRFYDAPAAIILLTDKVLGPYTWAVYDIGAISQTICLAAMQYGLGTCIEEQGIVYKDVIRKHTGISEAKEIIMGIALGYPDMSFPANQLVSRRASVDEVTTWLGF